MNHPSEWTQFLDERTGQRRYKQKGSGVVRDTLMTIGKTLKKGATEAVKKVVQRSAEKAIKNLAKRRLKKGPIKYNKYYKKGGQKHELPAKHLSRKRLVAKKHRRGMQ